MPKTAAEVIHEIDVQIRLQQGKGLHVYYGLKQELADGVPAAIENYFTAANGYTKVLVISCGCALKTYDILIYW